MYRWTHVFFLLIVNIILILFMLYFFDFMQIINYRQLFSQIRGQNNSQIIKIEDPLLLEKEELAKKWELVTIKQTELSNEQNIILSNQLELENEKNKLNENREAFLNEQTLVKIEQDEKETYDIKITDVATQIAGMPPQTAAELLNLQDDLQVVDILKKMDQLAAEDGQASTVPFLLTLMEREKAARVQSLMLVNEIP